MMKINISGAKEFRRGLETLPKKIVTKAKRGTQQTAGFVRNRAQIYAEFGMHGPGSGRDDGALGNGIQSVQSGKISYSVVSTDWKSPLYENGFKSHIVSAILHPEVKRWADKRGIKLYKGKYLFIRGDKWNRREFMTRAFWDGKRRYPRIMAEAMSKSISESFGGA